MTEPFANIGEVFERPADLGSLLSDEERQALEAFNAEALARMEADQGDPTSQQFFMRLDTKTVIKDEKEYERCQKLQVGLRVIPYGHALHLLKEEDARRRRRLKAKKARKVARSSRKANRK